MLNSTADDEIGCTDGDIRLQGGTDSSDGNVEYCHERRWVRVCDDEWGLNESRYVCGQLKFNPGGKFHLQNF